MKRSLILLIALTGINYCVLAQQDEVLFRLEHNKMQMQKVSIMSKNNSRHTVDLTLECKWDSIAGQIFFVFDRSADLQASNVILCFSMYSDKNPTLIKRMNKYNSTLKVLWRKKNTGIRQLYHFLKSDYGTGDVSTHYITLANGIMETFNFYMNNSADSNIPITFKTYFIQEDKKFLSKRNMRIIGEAYDLNVRLDLFRPVIDPCKGSDEIVNAIDEKISLLDSINKNDIAGIKSKTNCAANLKTKQTEIEQSFLESYPEWEKFLHCELVEEAWGRYDELRTLILSDTCVRVTRTVAGCNLDFTSINELLMNLQIDILRKKRNKENIEAERTEYTAIKNDTDKKITARCPKNQVDSYRSFCRNIEIALNE